MNRSARACVWEEEAKAGAEAFYSCPDPDSTLCFSEMKLLQMYEKHEHLSKWSPCQKYTNPNSRSIGIPEHLMQFEELITFTENVVHQWN